MQTYKAVMAQIDKLQQKADQLRKSEIKDVVKRIRDAIGHYGLTAADLGFPGQSLGGALAGPKAAKNVRASQAKGAAKPGIAKFRDPATGKTWTGRGKPPAWIVGVADRSPFLISGGAGAATGDTPPKAPAKGKAKAAKASTRKAAKPAAAPAASAETPAG